jgi:archaellum component FlaC
MIQGRKNTKMTLEKLAIMVANGFASTSKNIDSIKKEVEGVKLEVEGVKREVEVVKREVEGVKNQLEGTNRRIDDYAETKASKVEHQKLKDQVDFIEKKLEIKSN